jgi:predicted pyridoxine 5'-phosphate oxidase superfamily flavin-nucleotide-binding protein
METRKDVATLRQLLGEPKETTRCKIHHKLTAQAQAFIRHSPLVMLSTATDDGASTVSPKGDYAGFVQIGDEQTLYIPERQGNKLLVITVRVTESYFHCGKALIRSDLWNSQL